MLEYGACRSEVIDCVVMSVVAFMRMHVLYYMAVGGQNEG